MRRTAVCAWSALLAVACGGDPQPISSANGGAGGAATGGVGGLPTGGSGGVPGGDGGLGGGGFGKPLGRACASNAECNPGLTCFLPSKSSAGPAKGLCTTECSDAIECATFDPFATCQLLGQAQHCVEGCVPGGSESDFAPEKCHGREEVACTSLGGGYFGCLPTCNADTDCGAGYRCNPQTGLCQASVPSGLADGAACQDESECAGECLAQGSIMACAGRCTLGALPQCGWAGQGLPAEAYCFLIDPDNPSPGFGDAGHCGQLCNCDGDCLAAAMHCAPFPSNPFLDTLQKNGSCTTDASQPGLPCP